MMKRISHWLSRSLVVAVAVAGGMLGVAGSASAADSYGTPSISFSGVSNPPTSDKPQSKLWWNDGSWWADMWTSGSGWHIFRLDVPTNKWVDTGLLNDSRANTLADVLWDGGKLYIASHVVTVSTDSTPKPSLSGQPAKLYRYSYSGGTYTLDAGFPTTITNQSSESMTIDKDTTGAIWATWTQVTGDSTNGYKSTVYVNNSAPGGTSWNTPFVIPVANPTAAADDISAIVAFGSNKIGVMWSDQLTDSVHWAIRTDGTNPTATSSWRFQDAIKGKGQADDHLNIKTLQADNSGRVFAAVKTSLNDTSTDKTLPQLLLLVFKPATGSFSQSTIASVGDCVSRPQILLDTQNNVVHAFHTAPGSTVTGCAYSGVAGAIYEKTAPMDNPVFGSGRGTPVIQDGASFNMNDVTTTKQSVNSTSGMAIMASNMVTKTYWFAYRGLGSTPPPAPKPVASFTATPTSGTAPLNVAFTDTSSGSPTSWAWDFGDGTSATTQNPSHTYAAGTFTAKLTATNSAGSSTSSAVITVGSAPPPPPPPPTSSGITVGASSTAVATTASSTVSLAKPSGVAAGDVLVAAITADLGPSVTAPAGWTPIVNGLGINSSASSGAKVFSYYHVVGSADPASYSWTLSTAVKWGAGVTAYRGVNTTTPLDSSVATTVNTTYSATSITAPSITTASNGAMLIGGVGFDSSSPGATPPGGWTERWESSGGQIGELADAPQANAGASGTATWTFGTAKAVGVWRTALKPA
ncbi:PKD domain-containing protein [Arthrobacter sp. YD4]|uniref:PKD domain-containing protein n=1 Tax=Arthrobacter sp. YD4 TaxID=3058043 RepID=UPI0025B2D145|nr:PKD domain-containing protein [Arthrobacter sp. YD4]MDN3935306.1 PKD domain-containing protein [Arthrobacter sp. YD4]